MHHVRELELRFDGAIPPRLKRAAKALDEAERRSQAEKPAAGCRIGRVRLKPHAIVAQIANAMLNAAAVQGDCKREHLIGLGFTEAELDRYGAQAAHAAAVRAGMRQPVERD